MTNRDILINSVMAGHRPAWPGVGSWATFLIALLFTGICGAVWINNEAMAVWPLSEGAVQQRTRSLSDISGQNGERWGRQQRSNRVS